MSGAVGQEAEGHRRCIPQITSFTGVSGAGKQGRKLADTAPAGGASGILHRDPAAEAVISSGHD